MSNRLKYYIGKEISKNNHLSIQIANAMNISRGDDGSSLYVDVNGNLSPENEELINSIKKTNVDFMKVLKMYDNHNLKLVIDRNFAVKNILEEIVNEEIHLQPLKQNIVIDFSSPNIAKPFHVGHLRSTIIGNFIANINKHYQNNVVKINYLGDWGTQFGLLKVGLREQNINRELLKINPIKTLYDAYIYANKMAESNNSVLEEARQYFTEVERGDADLNEWKEIRHVTVEELNKTYNRLGVQFDAFNWESDYNAYAIRDVIEILNIKGILNTDKLGRKTATIKDREVVLIKSDDSTMYLSRDVAALLDRFNKFQFDRMLYVVDNSQSDHFVALFNIGERVDEQLSGKCGHVKFGRVKGMSTRKGTVVFLNDILNEAQHKIHEKQLLSPNTRASSTDNETCDILGVTAVVINDLKQRRQRDYTFSWEKALQTEGDSGIKLQYLHCRLWSIEQKCGFDIPEDCNPKLLPEPVVTELVTQLARFEDVLTKSFEDMEACHLVNYLFKLTKNVNSAVKQLRVMGEQEDVARQRLLLLHASRLVVRKGLKMLGVQPLNEM